MKHIQVSKMDSNMLISLVNMKLRNEYGNIDTLCIGLNIDKASLMKRLADAGYYFHVDNNQFRSKKNL